MSTIAALHIRDVRPDERAATRALTLAAYAELAEVMAPSAWEGLRQAILSALESSDAVRLLAEQDGQILGSVMLFPPSDGAYDGAIEQIAWPEMRALAVAPGTRNQGVGRALVLACMRRARQIGARQMGLHTSRSLRAAVHLYTSLGFVRAPAYDFQPPGAELVEAYVRDLADIAAE